MKTAPAAPVEPAADTPALPAESALNDGNFRVAESISLDDAAPIEAPEPVEETPAYTRRFNRHDEQMQAIVARRRETLDAERAEARAQGFPDQEPLAAQAAAEPPAAPVDAGNAAPGTDVPAEPDSGAAAPVSAPDAPTRRHKIVVRNQEHLMSFDDMRRAAELGLDSEIRIRQANATLEEARRLHATHQQAIHGAGISPPAAPPPPPAQPPSEIHRDAMRELARELLYGDEDKVVDALSRTMHPAAQPSPPVDPDAMAREVYGRIDARLNLQNALQTFGSEYPEIINDPDLATLGANYVQQLRGHYEQTGTRRAELDLFREAGNLVRQSVQRWRGDPQPDPAPQPAPQSPPGQSRITIKRSMPQAPAAAAAQQMTPAPRVKTGTDIVNQMRRERHQPVYT